MGRVPRAQQERHVSVPARRYDCHRDRFADHSLVICDNARPVALLPANAEGGLLTSHGGLTYGGFVTDGRMTTPLMLGVFDAVLSFCREQGFAAVRYKAIPYIYHRAPAEEDRYALYLCAARRPSSAAS
ncbi:MAG: hypothetical protein U0521_18815 [Anaerolineae bacterium]